MTRLLPLLILPLGVALLEYHGVQFWTVAVTGAWTGWFTGAFWLAWHAWGWPLLLEAGALWCWVTGAREPEPWRRSGWTFAGGVLTIVLCAAALWNVAAPVRSNQAVTAALEEERLRADAREDGAKLLAQQNRTETGQTRRRPMDNLLRTQERSVALFDQWMDLARTGKLTTDGQGRVMWWLQLACVVLGQGLVVAAARELGKGEQQPRIARMDTDERPPKHGDYNFRPGLFFDKDEGWVTWPRWRELRGKENTDEAAENEDLKRRAGITPERAWDPNQLTPWSNDVDPTGTRAAVSGGAEGVADAAGAGEGERPDEPHDHRETGAGRQANNTGDGRGPLPEQPERSGTSTDQVARLSGVEAPEEPEAREPVGARCAAVIAALQTRWPMNTDQERTVLAGLPATRNRDISLMRHHEKNRGIGGRKTVSENALAAFEAALGIVQAAPQMAQRIQPVKPV